jgi:hypothetical protein
MDGLGAPMSCIARLSNRPATPFNNTAGSRKGPLTGIFTDFMTIRIIDDESKATLFMGSVFNVKESYDVQYGNVIEVTARDGLAELRDNPTSGSHGFTIDVSASANVTVNPESATSEHTKLFTTGMAYRSDVIKSLINLNTRWNYSSNVPYNFDYSDTDRFITSISAYRDDGEYKLSSQSQKSALSHIASLAAEDPVALEGSNPTAFTYDYYIDPNSKDPRATTKSTPHFNYFKRGQRPHTHATPDPATYGFKLEFGGSSSTGTWDSTTSDGRQDVMLADFDLERPKTELFTDAIVNYTDTQVADTANLSKGGSVSGATSTKRSVRMEIIKIRDIESGTISNDTGLWTKLQKSPIYETGTSLIESGTSVSSKAEYLENTSGTKVARLQYLSALDAGTANVPEYAIISEVTADFPDAADAELRHQDYGNGGGAARFYLVSRPAADFGTRRTFITNASNATRPDEVRELVASKLMRSAKEVVRGRFRTLRKPLYYIDNSPGSVSGSQADQTITCASSVRPYTYGFRTGMTVNKLSSGEPSAVFGQAISVQSGADTSHIYWSTGTAATSDTLRYYIPIRAGDLIYVRNETLGLTGMKMLVTKIHYAEQPGVASMTLDVVGSETKAEGGWAKKHLGAAVAQATEETIELPPSIDSGSVAAQPVGGQASSSTLRFYSAGAYNRIRWGLNTNHASNATIEMAGGITATITAGGDTSANGTGTYALVGSDGTITTNSTTLTNSKTYTAFLDFKQQAGTAAKTVYLTEHVGIPYGDHIVRLAYIMIPANGTTSNAPTVMPINSASSVINADTINVTNLSAVSADMGTLTAGTGTFGSGTYNSNLTGIALGDLTDGNDSGGTTWNDMQFAGQVSGVTQVAIQDGVFKAAGGNIVADYKGLNIVEKGAVDEDWVGIGFYNGGSVWNSHAILSFSPAEKGTLTSLFGSGGSATAGRIDLASPLSNPTINWNSAGMEQIGSLNVNTHGNNTGWFRLPLNTASDGDVITANGTGSGTRDAPYEAQWEAPGSGSQSGTNHFYTSATASGSLPSGSYGTFRYTLDGAGVNNDTLGFTSNQTSTSTASGTDRSVFWVMQSKANYLILEPNLAYSGANNNAWIGFNNPLVGVRGFYMQAGNGTAANPSMSFYGNYDNGFFHNTGAGTGNISVSLEGTEEYQFAPSYFRSITDASLGSSTDRWDTVWGVTSNMSSDIRLKENIVNMTNGLDIVNALKPIEYTRIPDESKTQHFGFSAQHVKEVMLELGYDENTIYSEEYSEEKDDTDWGINLPELVAPLVSAIQELSEKVKKLEEDK